MARLRPQATTSLVERVIQEIRASILSGALRPGEQFSIAELCLELDVSHIPVREALRRLEADGLVMLRPSKSAIVTPLSLEELDEVYRLRLLIETDLAARSASSYTSQQLERAEKLCEELRSPAGGARQLVGAEAHARLHETLLSPAVGPLGTRSLQRLWDVAERYISLVYNVRPVAPDEPYLRHLKLVTIAKMRSGPKMRKAIRDHLVENKDYMVASLTPLLSPEADATAARLALGREDDDEDRRAAAR